MKERGKMTAREYLKQLEVLDFQIHDDLIALSDMRSNASGVRGIDYSRDKVQTSPVSDRLCDDVIKYTSLDKQINEEIDRFVDAKRRIIKEIRGLHDKNYIQVLTKIYVQFKSVKTTAAEIGKSYSHTVALHNQALEKFEETYKNLHYLT